MQQLEADVLGNERKVAAELDWRRLFRERNQLIDRELLIEQHPRVRSNGSHLSHALKLQIHRQSAFRIPFK